jgi:Flp pilus assembly protein TadB
MDYDWEKIFKNKTSKELFDIVTGKVILSSEAFNFAVSELKRRGFDTNDVTFNRKVLRLSNLISENEYEAVFRNNFIHISFKSYILLVIGITLFSLILNKYSEITMSIGTILILIGAVTIIVLLENVNYKMRKRKQIKRINEIKKLKSELENTESLNKKKQVLNELKRQKERTDKDIGYLVIVFLILIIIAGLARMFSFMNMK